MITILHDEHIGAVSCEQGQSAKQVTAQNDGTECHSSASRSVYCKLCPSDDQLIILESPVGEVDMSSLSISMVVFAGVLGGGLLGMLVSPKLPIQHQSAESKDVVRLAMGLVATTVAVALGLLIASAKGFYDTQSTEMTQLAADFILLDRVLAEYGPEATDARDALRAVLSQQLESSGASKSADEIYGAIKSGGSVVGDDIFHRVRKLSPVDDNQRFLKSQAMSLTFQLGQIRWLMFEQSAVPIPNLLLVMLIGWLIVLFMSFGIFAPRNLTVIAGLLIGAVAVCGAILLILEMYHPQTGLIRVSDAPLRAAFTLLRH
jgi:hypothetical protein